jgi:hypothetical protein
MVADVINNIICQEVSEKPLDGLFEMNIYNDDGFHDHPPYRAILTWLADHLNAIGHPTVLTLPKITEDEDEVDASITVDKMTFPVYFENSLGYIAWYSSQRGNLLKIARLIHNVRPQIPT